MKSEYLIVNLLIIIGPLLLSFDRTVHYFRYWLKALISILFVMIPFLVWDIAVTGKHWQFNEAFTLQFRLLGLPIEEYLFFITVPFSCLFIWQIIVTHQAIKWINNGLVFTIIAVVSIILGIQFILWGKIYTSLMCFMVACTIFIDDLLKTHLFRQKRTYKFLLILTELIGIFNGYLTSRPIVLYEPKYLLNFKIWTIPVEDFIYGYTLISMCTIIFEKLKGRWNAH